MNRSIIRDAAISLSILMAYAGLASAASADDGNKGDLETVKIARSGENLSARVLGSIEGGSLSAKIALPVLNPNPMLPKVVLSSGHKKTCLKQVGDKFDAVAIKDIDGKEVNLLDELSDRLTVVVFWSEKSVTGYEQFRRIPVDVLSDFAPHRVKVVAVNVGGTVAETKRLTGDAANKLVSLADTDSALFTKVANADAPRTYVLDENGQIVWFDIEYSESTRRSLGNALTYFIKQATAEEK